MREARYKNVVMQNTDSSCGADALATILKYAYHQEVTENVVLRDMLKLSDPEQARQRGFSMPYMKNYVESLGLVGRGYKLSGNQLEFLKVPTIVLLDLCASNWRISRSVTKPKAALAVLGNPA